MRTLRSAIYSKVRGASLTEAPNVIQRASPVEWSGSAPVAAKGRSDVYHISVFCVRYTSLYSQGMQIEWRNKARKQLKKLRNPLAVPRILTAIEDFAAGKACDVEA
ncbi:MAG: hypothetical protein WBM40_19390, partial [Thiohalocapsa sp.]